MSDDPSRRPDTVSRTLVQFSTVEDTRRVIFSLLAGALPEGKRSRLASALATKLRDAGLLGSSLEQHYSAADAAKLMGCRCSAWAVKHAKRGDFGPVACDGGDWLIPASGLHAYLAAHTVTDPVTDRNESSRS